MKKGYWQTKILIYSIGDETGKLIETSSGYCDIPIVHDKDTANEAGRIIQETTQKLFEIIREGKK